VVDELPVKFDRIGCGFLLCVGVQVEDINSLVRK
jgi:hypothetical protein